MLLDSDLPPEAGRERIFSLIPDLERDFHLALDYEDRGEFAQAATVYRRLLQEHDDDAAL